MAVLVYEFRSWQPTRLNEQKRWTTKTGFVRCADPKACLLYGYKASDCDALKLLEVVWVGSCVQCGKGFQHIPALLGVCEVLSFAMSAGESMI